STKTKALVYMIIALLVMLLAIIITADILVGILFTLGIALAFGLLWGAAQLLIKGILRFFPARWPYVWRQGLANLYRPQNQTTTPMLSLVLGFLLVSTLFFSQDMIMQQLNFASEEDTADIVLFDIQADQNETLKSLLHSHNVPILQNVPIVTMRIQAINGQDVEAISQDSSHQAERWALQREYRSTYRDSLTDSESIVSGKWIGKAPTTEGPIPISIADEIAEDLAIGINDTLTFNVQGLPIKTYVSSVREVDFQQVQPNFFVVFPEGVLEKAPQIYVTLTKTTGQEQSQQIQRAVVKAYPNVSVIDVSRILATIQAFIDKISLAIQFMALFSIVTGLIVLASSVMVSRF